MQRAAGSVWKQAGGSRALNRFSYLRKPKGSDSVGREGGGAVGGSFARAEQQTIRFYEPSLIEEARDERRDDESRARHHVVGERAGRKFPLLTEIAARRRAGQISERSGGEGAEAPRALRCASTGQTTPFIVPENYLRTRRGYGRLLHRDDNFPSARNKALAALQIAASAHCARWLCFSPREIIIVIGIKRYASCEQSRITAVFSRIRDVEIDRSQESFYYIKAL